MPKRPTMLQQAKKAHTRANNPKRHTHAPTSQKGTHTRPCLHAKKLAKYCNKPKRHTHAPLPPCQKGPPTVPASHKGTHTRPCLRAKKAHQLLQQATLDVTRIPERLYATGRSHQKGPPHVHANYINRPNSTPHVRARRKHTAKQRVSGGGAAHKVHPCRRCRSDSRSGRRSCRARPRMCVQGLHTHSNAS